jgi:excisionase family DNA binding protein
MEKDFYKAEELAKYLRIPLPTIYYLTREKKIPAIKIGKHWRYRRERIKEWLRVRETKIRE